MESVSLQLAKFIKKSGVTQVFTVTGGGAMFFFVEWGYGDCPDHQVHRSENIVDLKSCDSAVS